MLLRETKQLYISIVCRTRELLTTPGCIDKFGLVRTVYTSKSDQFKSSIYSPGTELQINGRVSRLYTHGVGSLQSFSMFCVYLYCPPFPFRISNFDNFSMGQEAVAWSNWNHVFCPFNDSIHPAVLLRSNFECRWLYWLPLSLAQRVARGLDWVEKVTKFPDTGILCSQGNCLFLDSVFYFHFELIWERAWYTICVTDSKVKEVKISYHFIQMKLTCGRFACKTPFHVLLRKSRVPPLKKSTTELVWQPTTPTHST